MAVRYNNDVIWEALRSYPCMVSERSNGKDKNRQSLECDEGKMAGEMTLAN